MTKFFLHLFLLILLITLQVSFIHVLPYPFDRIPLVLVVTIYLYQYSNQTSMWWWLISYGFALDLLGISLAPLEVISYGLTAFAMTFLVAHIFTNRSFYGMAATALLSLCVLLVSELVLLGATQLFASVRFSWEDLFFSQLWAMAFSSVLLLFIFPSLRRVRLSLQRRLFHL